VLVRRIAKGVEQRESDTLRLAGLQAFNQCLDFLRGWSAQHATAIIETLRKFEASIARDERRRSPLHQVIQGRSILAAYFQHIGKALCSHERGASHDSSTAQASVGAKRTYVHDSVAGPSNIIQHAARATTAHQLLKRGTREAWRAASASPPATSGKA